MKLRTNYTCLEYGMQSGSLSEELVTMPGNPYGYAKESDPVFDPEKTAGCFTHERAGLAGRFNPARWVKIRLPRLYAVSPINPV